MLGTRGDERVSSSALVTLLLFPFSLLDPVLACPASARKGVKSASFE
jgi:hypothetical protein